MTADKGEIFLTISILDKVIAIQLFFVERVFLAGHLSRHLW